jgi:hypothetical protein
VINAVKGDVAIPRKACQPDIGTSRPVLFGVIAVAGKPFWGHVHGAEHRVWGWWQETVNGSTIALQASQCRGRLHHGRESLDTSKKRLI